MKILIFIFSIILSININASVFSPKDFQTNDSKLEEKKKKYKDLISFLENSNNGEYYFYLATIYTNGIPDKDEVGDTVKKDTKKAIIFFNKSIDKEFYLSAGVLGSFYLYHEDFIVQKDNLKNAEKLLKLSIKNELYDSTTIISDLYFNYMNKPKEALNYLTLGANHNISTAQLALASLYHSGYSSKNFNLKKNDFLSSKYLTLACTNKNKTPKVNEICTASFVEKTEEKK